MAKKNKTDRRLVRGAGAAAGAYVARRIASDDERGLATILGAIAGWTATAVVQDVAEAALDGQAHRARALLGRGHEDDE